MAYTLGSITLKRPASFRRDWIEVGGSQLTPYRAKHQRHTKAKGKIYSNLSEPNANASECNTRRVRPFNY